MTQDSLTLTRELLTAYLAHNQVPHTELVQLIEGVHATIVRLAETASGATTSSDATVSVLSAPNDGDAERRHSKTGEMPVGARDFPPEASEAQPENALSELPDEAAKPAAAGTSPTPAPRPARTDPAGRRTAPAPETTVQSSGGKRQTAKVAHVRQEDVSDPVFAGLDPWLAKRISSVIASKLDADNAIHPSVFPDYIVCLEDGGAAKLLRPYLENRFNLTLDDYRRKWRLPENFPHAAPATLQAKRASARAAGLGSKIRGASRGNSTIDADQTRSAQRGDGRSPAATAVRKTSAKGERPAPSAEKSASH